MKTYKLLVTAFLCAFTFTPAIIAQEQDTNKMEVVGPPNTKERKIEDPETVARQRVDEMNHLLQLNEKQYKKIYKLLLKNEKKRRETMENRASFGGGGGMPPMMMGNQQGTPPPPPNANGGDMQGGGRPPMMAQRPSQNSNKDREKFEKKMKKILTNEQYEQWKKEQNRPAPQPQGQDRPAPQPKEELEN